MFLLVGLEELSRVEIVRNDPEVCGVSSLLWEMHRYASACIDLHSGLVFHMLKVLLDHLCRARQSSVRQGFVQGDVRCIQLRRVLVAQLRTALPAAKLVRDDPREGAHVAVLSLVARKHARRPPVLDV